VVLEVDEESISKLLQEIPSTQPLALEASEHRTSPELRVSTNQDTPTGPLRLPIPPRHLFQVDLLTRYPARRGQWLRVQPRAASLVVRLQPPIPSSFTHVTVTGRVRVSAMFCTVGR